MHIILRIFTANRPLRYSHYVECRQKKLAQVLGGHDVGKKQPDHFPPDYVLTAKAKVKITGRHIKIVFPHEELGALVIANGLGIKTGQIIDGIVVKPAAYFPFYVFVELPRARQFSSKLEF